MFRKMLGLCAVIVISACSNYNVVKDQTPKAEISFKGFRLVSVMDNNKFVWHQKPEIVVQALVEAVNESQMQMKRLQDDLDSKRNCIVVSSGSTNAIISTTTAAANTKR